MPKAAWTLLDTRDDRGEILTLLKRLSPRQRLAWLDDCCRHACLPNSAIRPRVNQRTRDWADRARWDSGFDEKLTIDVFYDYWALCINYELNPEEALARLVAIVRRSAAQPA